MSILIYFNVLVFDYHELIQKLKIPQIVLFLLAMCLICTIMSGLWEQLTGRYFRAFLPPSDFVWAAKQALAPATRGVPGFFGSPSGMFESGSGTGVVAGLLSGTDNDDDENDWHGPPRAIFIAAIHFFSYMILLNTVVPISLYIR